MDIHVSASACAKTKPKGLRQSQEEEAPSVVTTPTTIHTGPILSHSHWTDCY